MQSRKERESETAGGEGKSERRWGTDRSHSPPLLPSSLADLTELSQPHTNSVTPPLTLTRLLFYLSCPRGGVGTGERERRASEREGERSDERKNERALRERGGGAREGEEQDPQRVPNSQQPPRRTSGQKQVAPTDGGLDRKRSDPGPHLEPPRAPSSSPDTGPERRRSRGRRRPQPASGDLVPASN